MVIGPILCPAAQAFAGYTSAAELIYMSNIYNASGDGFSFPTLSGS